MTKTQAVEQWMRDAYPAPWTAEVHPSLNRTTVRAADGGQVISGMNNAKATLIVEAVNSQTVLAAECAALRRAMDWRTMDSAPADGSLVQLTGGTIESNDREIASPLTTASMARWKLSNCSGVMGWIVEFSDASEVEVFDPTHWRPMPEPPKAASGAVSP